ncbi:unnamed protein product [Closterium sp. NIES-53]
MHSRLLVSGLPRSLPPLPPSPAPPCLPCIEGRQRAAPHSSSFPPMTSPLQTLHMDVWGPASVSGQGRERYFLLVIDDYTRYTTVFPLRSKGEVIDVLIPWIRAVRLQLRKWFRQDLPVLRLHSDRVSAAAAGPGSARTRGTGAAGTGSVGGTGAGGVGVGDPAEPGGAGVRGTGAGGAGAGDTGAGSAGAGGAGAGDTGAEGAGAGGPCAGGVGAGGAGAGDTGAVFPGAGGSRPGVRAVRTGRRVSRPRPPPVPGTHTMALRPSSVPLRVPLPHPPASYFPPVPEPESDLPRAASPTVSRLLASVIIDPFFESTGACALVAELVDFAANCRLDYATALIAESEFAAPPSVGGECALSTDVLEDRQEDFECLAAAVPRFASMLLASEGDPDAPDIPTPALLRRGDYGSLLLLVADSLRCRDGILEGVDYFQTFSPTPKMTTLRVLLHVAAQRDYELHYLDFSTQWSLWWPVYSLRQAPREWHDTMRTTLAALGFTPSTADPSLFLHTDTSLPPFYVIVCVDDLVFATADTEALTLVKSELQKRHTCTDVGELRSSLGLQITRDREGCTIILTQSHMVHQSVEPSGLYPVLVGCLMYLMTCTRPDLTYPLSLLARYVAPVRRAWGLCLEDGVLLSSLVTQTLLGSSCEAESYTGAMAAQELRWLTYMLTDFGEQPRSPPVLSVDNKAIISLCEEHRLEHKTKHIALRYFLARELQLRRLAYVATRANTTDIFTKALPPGDHQRFSTVLGLLALLFLTGLVTTCSPPLCYGAASCKDELEHFQRLETAKECWEAIVVRYSNPSSASLGRLFLPFPFQDLSAFSTVADLVTHLHLLDASYCAACTSAVLAMHPHPMHITMYLISTHLTDRSSALDAIPAEHPMSLVVDLFETGVVVGVEGVEMVEAVEVLIRLGELTQEEVLGTWGAPPVSPPMLLPLLLLRSLLSPVSSPQLPQQPSSPQLQPVAVDFGGAGFGGAATGGGSSRSAASRGVDSGGATVGGTCSEVAASTGHRSCPFLLPYPATSALPCPALHALCCPARYCPVRHCTLRTAAPRPAAPRAAALRVAALRPAAPRASAPRASAPRVPALHDAVPHAPLPHAPLRRMPLPCVMLPCAPLPRVPLLCVLLPRVMPHCSERRRPACHCPVHHSLCAAAARAPHRNCCRPCTAAAAARAPHSRHCCPCAAQPLLPLVHRTATAATSAPFPTHRLGIHFYLVKIFKSFVIQKTDRVVSITWLARDATAQLAVRAHLLPDQRSYSCQLKSAKTLYDAVVKRYYSPSSATLGHLALPFLFLELSDFTTISNLMTHLCSLDMRYHAALKPRSCAIAASRGTPRPSFFEGCSPSLLVPSVASTAAVDFLGAEEVGAVSAPSGRRHGRGARSMGGVVGVVEVAVAGVVAVAVVVMAEVAVAVAVEVAAAAATAEASDVLAQLFR